MAPTHDGLTMLTVNWPRSEFEANRKDVEGAFARALDLAPAVAERVRAATRRTRIAGTGDLPGFFCEPYGPGWALVGDAGYHKDPITAQGISDAFRDAEALARAIDGVFDGREETMAAYHRGRDAASMPMFELTCDFARLAPPPPELQQLLDAVRRSQPAMDDFVSVIAGTVSPPEFFGPENTRRILAGEVTA